MTTATEVQLRTRAVQEPLKARQVRDLLKHPDLRARLGRRDAALISVLVGGGLRIGECCRLTVDAVEVDRGVTRITTRTSKRRDGHYRQVTLAPQAARLLRLYLERDRPTFWLFEGRRHEHLSTSAGRRAVCGHLRAIGAGWAHAHTLRHTFCSLLMRESHDLYLVQLCAGHASPVTTAKAYLHYDQDQIDKAAGFLAGAINPRGGRGLRS